MEGGILELKCEICGRESSVLYEVIYKGRRGYACHDCITKYGLIKVKKADEPFLSKEKFYLDHSTVKKKVSRLEKRSDRERRNIFIHHEFPEFVENYGELVKRGREKLGLTQGDLAKELKVKVSYIKKIESAVVPPATDIAKRLERILGIKLFKQKKEEEYKVPSYADEDFSITLGDLIKFEDEGKSE